MGIFNNHRYYLLKALMIYAISFYPLKISSQLFSPSTFNTTALNCYYYCALDNCTTGYMFYVPFPDCTFATVSGQFEVPLTMMGMSMAPLIFGFGIGYYTNFFYRKYIKKDAKVTENISENSPLKGSDHDYQ